MATDKQINDLLNKCQYKYKDQTRRDISNAIGYFKELYPIPEKYNYPDGTIKELITLKGTIPVSYKDVRYNIPVQLYLADTHPYLAPICYVRPTPDMSVNVSHTVQANGRINLPFLNEWNPSQSDLYLLLSLMTMKFNEETPLFSKGSVQNHQPQPYQPQLQLQQRAAANQYQPLPYPSEIRPAYPTQVSSTPYPISNMNPITPYPANVMSSTNQTTPYPVTSNPYYPMPSNISQPQPSYMKSGSGSNIGQVRPSSASYNSNYSDETIKPEYYRMSLISAIQDKVRMKIFELNSVKQVEIDSLRKVSQDLQDGERTLNGLIHEAEIEADTLQDLTAELKRKSAQANEAINRMQHRDKADIEDAVVTPAPLYRQIMNLFAEESAIQDLLYYLSQGLQRQTISLDVFLKQVRILSRRQFMVRATMQKAREKAALPL